MKRWLVLGIVFCLACSALALAGNSAAKAAGPFGNLIGGMTSNTPAPDEPPVETQPPVLTPQGAFDERVRHLTSLPVGNRCDWAQIAGYTVSRGYLDDHYCLIEEREGSGERVSVTASDPQEFVAAGDAYIYYGQDQNGKFNWVIKKPGEDKVKKLELGISDAVFYADEDFIWYYTYIGEEISVRKLARKDNQKTGLLRTKARVVVMREDGGIVLADFDQNRVLSWKDKQFDTLYQPEEAIETVLSNGMHVCVQHADRFGLIRDGQLLFTIPGKITNLFSCSSDQLALLVSPYEGSPRFDVWFFNEIYEAYAHVGSVLASDGTNIELLADQIIVWGPEESIEFSYPPVEAFLPYDGHASQEAMPTPVPVATQEPQKPKPVFTLATAEPAEQPTEQPTAQPTERPIAPPAAQGQTGSSRLHNYQQWLGAEADLGLLDTLAFSETDTDGALARECVSYPHAWPASLLRGAIPEYKGEGWLYDLFVIHPVQSNNAEDLLNVAVTIYEYAPADIDAYVVDLQALGFVEMSASKPDWADALRVFQADGRTLSMAFAQGEGGSVRVTTDPDADVSASLPFVQLSVDFDQTARVPSLPDPNQRGLFSLALFAEVIGMDLGEDFQSDMVSDDPADSLGRVNRTVYYPSSWPRDAFQDLIPEYLHAGVMESVVITMPAKTPNAERMLTTSLFVQYCLPDEVAQYAAELMAYGYEEVPPAAFTSQERGVLEQADTLRIFSFPGFTCYLRTDEDEGNYALQITLMCDGRYNEFFER